MVPKPFHIEEQDEGFWAYIQRSAGELLETPLHRQLKWLLEQLNLGNLDIERDSNGDVVSMTIGRAAAPRQVSREEVADEAKHRLRAIKIAAAMAEFRESGITPRGARAVKQATLELTEWGHRNTEFHYAFEANKVLERLNEKNFQLEAPPILGVASEGVISYLREATRCWLYGFHGASIAISRACLEESLKARVPMRKDDPTGASLEKLIESATTQGLLDRCLEEMAHRIRKAGNKFLHGKTITERQSRETLDYLRNICEHLFSA